MSDDECHAVSLAYKFSSKSVNDYCCASPGFHRRIIIEQENMHPQSIAFEQFWSYSLQEMATKELTTVQQIFFLLRRIHMHWGYFLIPTFLFLIVASLEGVGMGLLIPILHGFLQKDYSFIKDIPGIATVLSFLPGNLDLDDRMLFVILMGSFVVVILLKNILRYCATLSMSYLGVRTLHHLRKQVFNTYLSFGKLYFDRTSVGHHSTVLSQFTTYALQPLLTIDRFIHALFSIVVYIIVMCFISWKLTLFAIPLFFILHYGVKGMIVRLRHLSVSIAERTSALGKKGIEILSLIPLVKARNMEEEERHRFAAISDEGAKLAFRAKIVEHIIHPLQEMVTLFAVLLLVAFMLHLLVREQSVAAPSFLIYFYLVLNIVNRFGTLTGLRSNLANATGPVAEIVQLFDRTEKHMVPDGKRECTGLQRAITFRNLHFSYGEDREILRDLSFSIEQGKVTAIVGPTGAGKTTIISLLLRYYDCPPGSLFFDDADIREFTAASLRSHIALVSQETLLLHDTLRNNITYGASRVSEEQLLVVVERARLLDYVEELPQGLETLIGDRGVKLSGGEKQRVSIARALLAGADILILDEATSSLDSKTEKLVQEAVEEVIRGKTAIVIAHRLFTIKNADKIVVIEEGRCIEEGTLEELKGRQGVFAAHWEAQKFD